MSKQKSATKSKQLKISCLPQKKNALQRWTSQINKNQAVNKISSQNKTNNV